MDPSTESTRKGCDTKQSPEADLLCARGCGFFGQAENRGLCSKCYTDSLKEKIAKSKASIKVAPSDESKINIPEEVETESKINIPKEIETESKINIPKEIETDSATSGKKKGGLDESGSPAEVEIRGRDDSSSSATITTPPVVKKRCGLCNKRVGVLGFGCRCGGTFCGAHRHPEAHTCGIDFKKAGKFIIQAENPVCIADKLANRV